MNVWLVKDGEHLPVVPGARSLRVSNLAKALVARGHSVTWWSSTHSHQEKRCLFEETIGLDLKDLGFRLQLLHVGGYQKNISPARFLHHGRFGWKLFAAMKASERPDVIVCCLPIIEAVLACLLYSKLERVPLVVDVRDLWPDGWIELVPKRLAWLAKVLLTPYYAATRLAYWQAEGIVAISEHLLETALNSVGRQTDSTTRVFRLGADRPREFAPESAPEIARMLEDVKGKTLLVFCGAFGHTYDLETVCRAVAELGERDDFHLFLGGDGPLHETLLTTFGETPNMTFCGWLDEASMNVLLAGCDLGIVPYKGEFLGNKVYEYLAFGLPLLATHNRDLSALVKDNGVGLLYQTGAVCEFKSQLVRLLEAPDLRAEMSARCLTVFANQFSAATIYHDYSGYLERLSEDYGRSG